MRNTKGKLKNQISNGYITASYNEIVQLRDKITFLKDQIASPNEDSSSIKNQIATISNRIDFLYDEMLKIKKSPIFKKSLKNLTPAELRAGVAAINAGFIAKRQTVTSDIETFTDNKTVDTSNLISYSIETVSDNPKLTSWNKAKDEAGKARNWIAAKIEGGFPGLSRKAKETAFSLGASAIIKLESNWPGITNKAIKAFESAKKIAKETAFGLGASAIIKIESTCPGATEKAINSFKKVKDHSKEAIKWISVKTEGKLSGLTDKAINAFESTKKVAKETALCLAASAIIKAESNWPGITDKAVNAFKNIKLNPRRVAACSLAMALCITSLAGCASKNTDNDLSLVDPNVGSSLSGEMLGNYSETPDSLAEGMPYAAAATQASNKAKLVEAEKIIITKADEIFNQLNIEKINDTKTITDKNIDETKDIRAIEVDYSLLNIEFIKEVIRYENGLPLKGTYADGEFNKKIDNFYAALSNVSPMWASNIIGRNLAKDASLKSVDYNKFLLDSPYNKTVTAYEKEAIEIFDNYRREATDKQSKEALTDYSKIILEKAYLLTNPDRGLEITLPNGNKKVVYLKDFSPGAQYLIDRNIREFLLIANNTIIANKPNTVLTTTLPDGTLVSAGIAESVDPRTGKVTYTKDSVLYHLENGMKLTNGNNSVNYSYVYAALIKLDEAQRSAKGLAPVIDADCYEYSSDENINCNPLTGANINENPNTGGDDIPMVVGNRLVYVYFPSILKH